MADTKSATSSSDPSLPLALLMVCCMYLPVARGCPSQCSCSYQTNNQLAVLCTATDLSSPPHNVNPQTQLLTIMGQRLSPFSLSHLSRQDFRSLGNLNHLTVSFTHLASIEEDAFLDVIHLKRIDLANNKLNEILPNTFITLRNLTFISLSNNPGLVISDRAFWNLQSLQELYLSGVGLTELRPAMFYGLSDLRQLDVSSNKLTSFSPDIMVHMPNLWSLDLAFNELMSLDSLLEPYFVHLKRVQLGGNRWQCNCLLRWLKSYPQFIATRSSDAVVCSAPAGMEYVSLADVDRHQLVCDPPVIHTCPPSVSVFEGETLTIRCMVTGDPYPSITWTFADGTRMMSGSYPGMPVKDRAAVQVHNVPMSHGGNLTLTASNGVGTESTEIIVIVSRRTSSTSTTTTTTTPSTTSTTTPTTISTTTATTTSKSLTTSTTTPSTTETTHESTAASSKSYPSTTPTTTRRSVSVKRTTPTTSRRTLPTTTPATRKSSKSPRKGPESGRNGEEKAEKSVSPNEVDIAPIIIASVASTAALMMAGGIALYFLKKSKSPKHKHHVKSKVAPLTPESSTSTDAGTAAGDPAKDLTHHVLRMQKFDAPTRPPTLY